MADFLLQGFEPKSLPWLTIEWHSKINSTQVKCRSQCPHHCVNLKSEPQPAYPIPPRWYVLFGNVREAYVIDLDRDSLRAASSSSTDQKGHWAGQLVHW